MPKAMEMVVKYSHAIKVPTFSFLPNVGIGFKTPFLRSKSSNHLVFGA